MGFISQCIYPRGIRVIPYGFISHTFQPLPNLWIGVNRKPIRPGNNILVFCYAGEKIL